MRTEDYTSLQKLFKGLVLLLAFALPLSGNSQVTIDISDISGNQNVRVDFSVAGFDSIVSMQYTINWDPNFLTFVSVDSFRLEGLSQTSFATTNAPSGEMGLAWVSPNTFPKSLPDGTVMYSLFFDVNQGGDTDIFIDGTPVPIEIIGQNDMGGFIMLSLNSNSGTVTGEGSFVTGKVFDDANLDCMLDGTEAGLEDWIVLLDGQTDYSLTTNSLGEYNYFIDTGAYVLSVIPPSPYWENCQDSYNIQVVDGQTTSQDAPVQKLINCPYMTVDLSTTFLRRCFNSTYSVNYCNDGTEAATNAFVELTLDPYLTIEDASIPFSTQNGIHTFDLGTVAQGDCGSFRVEVYVDCDSTVLGQTHCSTAHIFPDSICTGPNYTGPSVEVSGECDEDSGTVNFTIRNVGQGNMTSPADYIVIEDVIMYTPQTFQLNSGEILSTISMVANGSTFRLEADQVPGHPGASMPSVTIEGCGLNSVGTISTGFVNMFPQDESDPFISIDCTDNRGAFDPNDKAGFPFGVGDEHFIEENVALDYRIRFQNTGTDTAFKVVILDTLSAFLDISTIRAGASSHQYDFELIGENVVRFTFDQIMLPDSNVNEPASHGFVNFRIQQQRDNSIGTEIRNSAAIYFDFNEPIITNETLHTIGEDFIQIQVSTQEVFLPNIRILAAPNPFSESTQLQVDGASFKELHLFLYDATGRLVKQVQSQEEYVVLHGEGLTTGLYFYQLEGDGQLLGNGKLMVH
ncbi:MAG: T9SS type A sorting domain-containing protein [Bacteroidota bacterium]